MNLGFEQPQLPVGERTCPKSIIGSAILTSGDVPGWETTHGAGDIWCTNNGGTTAFVNALFGTKAIDIWKSGEVETDLPRIVSAQGNQHAELSAWEKSRLYQTVCLVQGETINWEFSHTHRDNPNETMEFNISNTSGVDHTIAQAKSASSGAGTTLCLMGTCEQAAIVSGTPPAGLTLAYRNQWTKHSGSVIWPEPTGDYQVGFEGIVDGLAPDRGNLLDAIQLDGLKPFVQLSRPDYASVEGAATDDRLALLVSGTFTNAGTPIAKTIQVKVIPVTAGSADYATSAIIEVVITPIATGGYDNHSVPFHDQLSILADTLPEGAETFELEIVADNDFLIQSTSSCGVAGNARATYTIDEPQLTIEKTATVVDGNADPRTFIGDTISYEVTVTNSGSVPLTNIVVTDSLIALSEGGTVATLAAGASKKFTASYVLTASDMQTDEIVNTVTATAVANTANPTGSIAAPTVTDTHTQPLDVVKTLDFVKSARPTSLFDDTAPANGYLDAGERVYFDFAITNTGTVVANVTQITDDLPGFTFQPAAPTYTLNPGQSASFSGYYVATQADIDAGEIVNQATANYTAAGENLSVRSRSPTAAGGTTISIPVPAPGAILMVEKTVASSTIADNKPQPGDTLNYVVTVTNVSNVTVKSLTVVDPLIGVNQTGSDLPPVVTGQNVATFGPYAYDITSEDIDRGFIDNVASVGGIVRDSQNVSTTARHIEYLAGDPEVDLLKEATFVNVVGSPLPEVGDRIDFKFTVTNTGNISITGYAITDDNAVLNMTRTPPPLAAGEVDAITYVGSRNITAADVDAGYLENIAILQGTGANGAPVTVVSHGPDGLPTRLVLERNVEVAATLHGTWKDANSNTIADLGEIVEFVVTITNTGNVGLATADIMGMLPTDGLPADMTGLKLAIEQQISALAAGQSAVINYNHVLTQDDLDLGAIYAQVEVSGTGPASMPDDKRAVRTRSYDPTVQNTLDTDRDGKPDYPTVVKLPQLAKLQVEKTGKFLETGPIRAGSEILYEIVISNVGNVTLNNVYPLDQGITFGSGPASGVLGTFTPGPVTLGAGEKSPPFQAFYTITEADVANATRDPSNGVVNRASATGITRNGLEPEVILGEVTLETPWITIVKKALIDTVRVGEIASYSLELTTPEGFGAIGIAVKDVLPPGFLHLPDSATANGAAVSSSVDGGTILFHNVTVLPETPIVIVYGARVGASVKSGEHRNRAFAVDPSTGQRVSNEATAIVNVASEAIFDCATILGQVFVDENHNGYRDKGEPGVPGSSISDISGARVTTDAHGRFSIPCVSRTVSRIGSSHLLKLDPRSLPTGYRIVTENPRHVRLSAGSVSTVEFGVTQARVLRIDITDDAFTSDGMQLRPEWARQVETIVNLLQVQPSVLRIVYRSKTGNDGSARSRIWEVRRAIEKLWRTKRNRYRLDVETAIIAAQ